VKISSILGSKPKIIQVVNRETGQKFNETVYGEDAMKVFYGTRLGMKVTESLLTHRWVSNLYGAYNDSGASKHKIEEFVSILGIDILECEKDITEYHSFNDFFARKLKSSCRKICEGVQEVASPGDGRLLVFPEVQGSTLSYVKWAPLKLIDLFGGNESLTQRYKNGSCAILRLCPSDYHRVHFPVSGKVGITRTLSGALHSVSPYALEQKIPVYCLNKRTLCELESEQFGKVLVMEVGAMFVGGVVQTYRAGMQVQKGDEKGYFKFGGSTSILFFEKGSVTFDPDLIDASGKGFETYVKMGDRIATVSQESSQ
jgi:phosphatidylserine decarboxylase